MEIENIIAQIPEWKNLKTLKYEPLKGGYSNPIYKVFADNKSYALRINSEQNIYLQLEYKDEIEIIKLAAKQGISPNVLACENTSDFLITEFIDSRLPGTEEIKEPVIIQKIVNILKRVHQIPYKGKRKSTPFSLNRGYLIGAKKLGITYAEKLKDHLKKVDAIEKVRQKDPVYFAHYCHNDAFIHNMLIDQNEEIKLIDWELSGVGDIWYDLATVSFSNGYNNTQDELMVETYFGDVDDKKLATLADMKYVCMIREIGWALLTTGINRKNGFRKEDYLEFADTVLDRLNNGLLSLV